MILAASIYPPDIGGPATYAKRMVDENGWSVVTFDRNIENKWKRYWKYFTDLLRKGETENKIYAMDPICSGLPTLLASLILRKPYNVRIGGDYAWERHQLKGGSKTFEEYQNFQWDIFWMIERLVIGCANKVIVPCQYLGGVVTGWGASSFYVIPNEVTPFPKTEDRETLRNGLGYKKEDVIFLFVGRHVPWKNFEMLRSIFYNLVSKLIKDKRFATLIAIGPDWIESDWLVDCKSKQDRKTLAEWYKTADYLLLPSSWEGSPHVVKEARSFGLPCIISDIPGHQELKGEGVTLVPLLDEQAWERAIRGMVYK